MKHISTILLAAVTAILVTSCSENTVGGGMIQKRKYTKGFYLNRHASGKNADEKTVEAVTVQEEQQLAVTEKAVRPAHANAAPVTMTEAAGNSTRTEVSANAIDPKLVDAPRIIQPKIVSDASTPAQRPVVTEQTKPAKGQTIIQQKRAAVQQVKNAAGGAESGAMLVLLVILAILIPPLAVAIYEGITTRFWIDLILAILGFGIGFWLLGGLGWLCALAAVIYALLIVLGVI
jgi:uncharacterized membrane protein YqaE (UPF0057 family)